MRGYRVRFIISKQDKFKYKTREKHKFIMRNNNDSTYNKVSIHEYYKKALTRYVAFQNIFRANEYFLSIQEMWRRRQGKNTNFLLIMKLFEHTCLPTFDKMTYSCFSRELSKTKQETSATVF